MARKPVEGQLGMFRPDSDWVRPEVLPDLRGRRLVALDLENKDVGLASGRCPGWVFGAQGGYVCGVAWAAEGSVGYAPVAHPDSDNFPLENVVRWIDDICQSDATVVVHNGPYEVGWFGSNGIRPPKNLRDTLCAAVMLDETHREYSLDAVARREGIPGNDRGVLQEAVRAFGGVSKKPEADIWMVPDKYAGPYAEADAVATLTLWQQQEGAIRAQGMWDAFETEMDLIPMTVAMRRRGIRVNANRAYETARHFRRKRDEYLREIGDLLELKRTATTEELRSPRWMENRFAQEGIRFPRTVKTGQGSFSKDWMEKHAHPLPRAVTQALKFEEAASKFIDNFILGFSVRGRIHSEVHQFLSEEGGTRSHRLSYSEPPLQQMTSPDKDPRDDQGNLMEDLAVGTKLRMCFLPEENEFWCASDYSQQEPRLTVHFAAACNIAGVEDALERYRNNPRTDYHTMVAEMTSLARPRAKILNLAMTYGKGKHSTAEELGVSVEEAELLLKNYHERLPFIKPLEDLCKRKAQQRGYIRLIDGARMHYNEWEGGWMEYEERKAALISGHRLNPCSLEEARERQANPEHPWSKTRLRRADTRKSLNNLVQGSAARQTKRAMREMFRQGLLPLLQMHDELDHSVHSREQVERIARIMVETTPLLVPTVVDSEVGPNWGEAKFSWNEYMKKREMNPA